MRRLGAIFLVLLLSISAVGAVAQSDVSEGPFERTDLVENGVHPSEAPDSVRMLGDPVRGSMAVRYTPVSPLQNEYKFISPGQTVETDYLQLYSNAYGDATGDYELVVVQWSPETKRVQTENGSTTHQIAANQTVQRIDVTVEDGYATADVKLQSNFDETREVTMWLERDGEAVDGARWRFQHRSNPLAASLENPIDSEGDKWRAMVPVLLPIPFALYGGRYTAKHFLDRTIVGPMKGGTWWGLVIGFTVLVAVSAATWQTAAVLARAPYVVTVVMYFISTFAFLGFYDDELETAEFAKMDLEDTTSVSGEDSKTAIHEERHLRSIVRRDGKIYMPKAGLRSFFARYWAPPAEIEEHKVETVKNVSGDISKVYEIDPESDKIFDHTPARLVFSPTIFHSEDETAAVADGGEPETKSTPSAIIGGIAEFFDRINWRFIGASVFGGSVVYFGMMEAVGAKSLAFGAALIPAIIAGYEARGGKLDFDLAPVHFSDARAVLNYARKHYNRASTFEDLESLIAENDAKTLEEARGLIEAFRNKLRDRMDVVNTPTQNEETRKRVKADD